MENDPIFCFQHCDNVLCLRIPESCPACFTDLSKVTLKIPPFRLPTPFSDSIESPYSVVIKPTNGTFLRDYSREAALHVGVTDSHGIVYDYSALGISRHENGWNQVLAIPITTKKEYGTALMWDVKLQEFCAYHKWQRNMYDEHVHNCYTFALDFLQFLQQHTDLSGFHVENKSDFITEMILPLTKQAAKYIALYRKLADEGTIVQYEML